MDPALREFARFTNDSRVRPRFWHFSYPHLRNNYRMFLSFVSELRSAHGSNTRLIRVLDVGCGFKPFSSLLDPALFQVHGVDYSAAVSSADALAGADALPFVDGSFDAAIVSEVLEHVRYPDKAIAEVCRVVRQGGHLFVSTPFVFWEHGVPYDFQRPTRYFFRAAFADQEVLRLSPSNTILWSGITLCCLFVESTPLHRVKALCFAIHYVLNLVGAALDWLTRAIGSALFRNWEDRFLTAPVGYAMLVRVKQRPEA